MLIINQKIYIRAMLNIPSTVHDPNYRYRMPKMQLKIQSKGNGIKTNIVNLPDVAKHLRTNEEYILKFFGFQKASQTTQKSSKGNDKTNKKNNTSYIIQGSFSDEELLKTLDKFIEKYILCPKCKLPEMHLYVSGDKIQGKCDSCPFNGDVDNKHKLASLILKKPPTYKPQAMKNAESKIEKIKTTKKEESGQATGVKIEEISAAEIKTEEVEAQVEQMATQLFHADDLEFDSEEMVKLINYTKNYIEKRKSIDFDIASAEIVANLKPLGLKKPLIGYVLFNAFFTVNILKQIQQNAKLYLQLMRKLVGGSAEIETFLNIQYLFLEVNKDKDFSKYIPTILMKAYQNEFFGEELVVKWSKNQLEGLDKMFLYNQARNEKFLEIAQDFIDEIVDEEEEEAD